MDNSVIEKIKSHKYVEISRAMFLENSTQLIELSKTIDNMIFVRDNSKEYGDFILVHGKEYGHIPEQFNLFRIFIGSGRPDMLETTQGTLPSDYSPKFNDRYVSTDGAGTGAWEWQYTDKWKVTNGDTGWYMIYSDVRMFDTGKYGYNKLGSAKIFLMDMDSRTRMIYNDQRSGMR